MAVGELNGMDDGNNLQKAYRSPQTRRDVALTSARRCADAQTSCVSLCDSAASAQD